MMSVNDLINKHSKADEALFLLRSKYLLIAFTFITVLAVFVPLNPTMPAAGIDPSWMFAINEAVARHLNFGKDIVFTFGPYASIYSHNYHPATDNLMVFGGLFLGLSYVITLLYLSENKTPYLLFGILIYLASFIIRDTLFFIYPLILAVCAVKLINETEKEMSFAQWLLVVVIFLPLGLFPLIKGSFLLLCVTISIAIVCYFSYHRCFILSLLALISPLVSMLIFWRISGQSIAGLADFFVSLAPIMSGYAEAMAEEGGNSQIVIYILATIAIIFSIMVSKNSLASRLFLSICFLLFLFIAFKAGFTRYDNDHIISVASALVFAVFIFSFIPESVTLNSSPLAQRGVMISFVAKYRAIVLLLPITIAIYFHVLMGNVLNPYHTYTRAWDGLYLRLTDNDYLKSEFERNLDVIRKENIIPSLNGSTDIYSFDISSLLASNNQWKPRPVIQSYSAYMPVLARMNEQYVRGDNAPDNIAFEIHTIDGRFPTLDDGLSFPAILDNYAITKIDDNFRFVYLRKNSVLQKSSLFNVLYEGTHKIKQSVFMPASNEFVYAEINIKPTLLGRLMNIVYKLPQLHINLKLKDGSSERYRIMANMVETGFFISPLVRDTKDFAMVASDVNYLNARAVESFTITTGKGGKLFWTSDYQIKLKTYQAPRTNNPFAFPFDKMLDFSEKQTAIKKVGCEQNQSIDQVNGVLSEKPNLSATSLLTVSGWLAFSAKKGIAADETFVTLTDAQGRIKYIKAHATARPDVKTYFNQPALSDDIGFIVNVDVTQLQGDYALGLAKTHAGKLEQCLETLIPISIKPTVHHESQ